MKKLINDPANVVREELQGIEAAHSDLVKVFYDPYYITRKESPIQGKVALLSGGGSGHEPMHGGFVGKGMLDAACPGEVFTSPTPDQMEAATKAVDGGAGVVHIVKNYTGDVMNFKLAAEDAADEGIGVEHAEPDEAAVHRLVTRAAAGDEGDLALAGRVLAQHHLRRGVDAQDVAVRRRETGERVLDDLGGIVEQLAHRAGRDRGHGGSSHFAAATPPGSGVVTAVLIGRAILRGSARKSYAKPARPAPTSPGST